MDKQLDDEFKALCDSYDQGLPNKISNIENSFANLCQKWDSQNYINFTFLIHNLTGSAGIYGHEDMSIIANKIETQIAAYEYNSPPSQDTLTQVKQLIDELKQCKIQSKDNSNLLNLQQVHSNLVYILFSNKDYTFGASGAEKLAEQCAIHGYELIKFTEIDSMITALKSKKPLTLMISYDFIFNPFEVNMNDPNIANALKLYFKNNYTIFISKSGEFEKRLNAFRMHSKSFLLLPFNMNELISELESLKFLWDGKFKAIIVDDDPEVSKYYSNLLSQAQIENKAINSYKVIESLLHNYQPDILLFDLNMPECSGIELAGIIRQQKKYEHIPIIFLSTEENRSIQLEALSVGAEDFITKSTDPNYIIQTIRIRASRYKKIKMMMNKDNLTGAFNYEYIYQAIEKFINLYKKTNYKLTIGILEIDNIDSIRGTYGHSTGDQLLSSLYLLLSNLLDPSRIIGSYSSNKFIIVFPNTTTEQATQEMNAIHEKFRSVMQHADGKAYASSFKMGFATYQNEKLIKDFISVCEENLVKHSHGAE